MATMFRRAASWCRRVNGMNKSRQWRRCWCDVCGRAWTVEADVNYISCPFEDCGAGGHQGSRAIEIPDGALFVCGGDDGWL